MRVQKSVYYMTDRELRIYKRQLRRRRQLQRRIVTMLATICVIAFCAVSYHGIRSLASSGEDQLKFKYYTQVTVAYGETLWDLSDDYIDYDEYKDKKEYIAEVQSINHLTEVNLTENKGINTFQLERKAWKKLGHLQKLSKKNTVACAVKGDYRLPLTGGITRKLL